MNSARNRQRPLVKENDNGPLTPALSPRGEGATKLLSADDLVAARLIGADQRADIAKVGARYAIALTPTVTRLIDHGDPGDPIARQFVPDVRELDTHHDERADPIGDHPHAPLPGLVHRYPDRVLLKIASVCPVYCRFCFRREMVGPQLGHMLSPGDVAAALDYIGQHREIWEVIMTGGDPFVLSPRRISDVTSALSAIPHVKVLRWHTRVPVVDPRAVSEQFIAALTSTDRTVTVAVHVNHPRELTDEAQAALLRLSRAGVLLLSQTVLLKGINDDAPILEALMRRLVECRIKPYYLHHCDLAPGTAHFRTTIEAGKAIMRELRRRLSGLAIPCYVLDIPGGYGKVDIEAHVHGVANGCYRVVAPDGADHTYRD